MGRGKKERVATSRWFSTMDGPNRLGACLVFLRQENFEVFLAFGDYSNHALVAELREQHIRAQEAAQAERRRKSSAGPAAAEQKSPSTESRLHRQALALQVSEQELEAELTWRALSDGSVGTALKKCRCAPALHGPRPLGKGPALCLLLRWRGGGGAGTLAVSPA